MAEYLLSNPSPFSLILGDGRIRSDPGGVAAATRHRLDPLLFEQLLREDGIPTSVRKEADRVLLATDSENRRLLAELLRVLSRLSDAGIHALSLKGPVLALLLWHDLRLRRSHDIDLLVPRERVADAVCVLESAGYRVPPPTGGLIREIHLEHARDPFILDLHWNVAPGEVPFPLAFEEIWNDRRQVSWDGAMIPVIGPEWLFVIISLYLVKDYPWPKPIYLSDLARFIMCFPDLDWERVAAIAARTGTRRICAVGLTLVGSLPGAMEPAKASRLLGADSAALSAVRQMKRAIDAPRDKDDHDDPTCRLRKIALHSGFRERWRDKMRVFGSIVPLLLHPGRMYTGQRWASASMCRLWRLAAALHHRRVARLPTSRDDLQPAPGTTFFPLDDGGLLLTATGHELYALSPSAAILWCCLEEGMCLHDIARRFAAASGSSRSITRTEIAAVLDEWRHAGLLGADTTDPPPAPPPICSPGPSTGPDLSDDEVLGWPRRYRLFDSVFNVRFSSPSLAEAVDTALGHLATTCAPIASASVSRCDNGILIAVDGRTVDRCADIETVAPTVKSTLVITAANRLDFWFFLHAAMVRKGSYALLLPAAPGRGKTCLSAALSRAGFEYCSDEITLLDRETLHARGLPTALAVKEEAWTVLQPMFPELSELRAHRRVDGRIVKYLPLPATPGAAPPDTPAPVRIIAFPRYVAGSAGTLTATPRAEALQCLMTECLAMRMELTPDHVLALGRWIETIRCYTLVFGDLTVATEILQKACIELDLADPPAPLSR